MCYSTTKLTTTRCSGKLGLQSLGFPANFDFTGHNFPGNFDRSGKLRLEKVRLTSLVSLVKQDSKYLKEDIPL